MIETCLEPEVLRYIVSVIEYPLGLETDGPSFTEKNKMFAALFLQVLMNALAKGLNGGTLPAASAGHRRID